MRTTGSRNVTTFAIALLAAVASALLYAAWAPSVRNARGGQGNSSGPPEESPANVQAGIRALIDGRDPALASLTAAERTELEVFYGPAAAARLWHDASGRLTSDGCEAWSLLRRAAEEGLDPTDYYFDLLQRLLAGRDAVASSPADRSRLDVVLTAGMLRYLHHLHTGRVDPRSMGFRLSAAPNLDAPAILRTAIVRHQIANAAAEMRPPFAQYLLLRNMLAVYRSMATEPANVELPAKALRPGDPFAGAGGLSRLLTMLGDLPADAAGLTVSERYDGVLVQGVKRFQLRQGLEPDGILGKDTVEALRVPLAWRVRQIELALERL